MFSTGPGFSTWRAATLTMGLPYVFFTYGLKDGVSWIYQTSIIWDSNDVLDFCRRFKNNKSAKIIDISLLEPFIRGKKQTLRWSRILEIRSYEDGDVEHPVYITGAGEAVGIIPNRRKPKMKLLCKAPRNRD